MEGSFDNQERIGAWLAAHPHTTDENLYTLEEEEVDLRDEDSIRLIEQDVDVTFQWGAAATLSTLLMIASLALFLIVRRFVKVSGGMVNL